MSSEVDSHHADGHDARCRTGQLDLDNHAVDLVEGECAAAGAWSTGDSPHQEIA